MLSEPFRNSSGFVLEVESWVTRPFSSQWCSDGQAVWARVRGAEPAEGSRAALSVEPRLDGNWEQHMAYPLVMTNIAMENHHL